MEITPAVIIIAPIVVAIEIILIVKEIIHHINNIKDKFRKKVPMDQTFKPFNFNN